LNTSLLAIGHTQSWTRGRPGRRAEPLAERDRRITGIVVDLLGDLTHTAGSDGMATAGRLLHTARGYAEPGEPGKATLLVGTSTNTYVAGHTWTPAG
jgi:hypothetical protein